MYFLEKLGCNLKNNFPQGLHYPEKKSAGKRPQPKVFTQFPPNLETNLNNAEAAKGGQRPPIKRLTKAEIEEIDRSKAAAKSNQYF